MAPAPLQSSQTWAATPVEEADPLEAPPSFAMRKASTFHTLSGELEAPPTLHPRSRASSTSSFVSTRVDFPLEEETDVQDPRKRPQWLTDAREKACKMYMQAAHSQTQLARLRSRRQPIESDSECDAASEEGDDASGPVSDDAASDSSDADASSLHSLTQSPRTSQLLDKLAACMISEEDPAAAIPDWRQPGQLDTFLARCLQGWESHAELTATNKQMQKHVQQSRRAVDHMQQRIQDLEAQNASLVCYAHHLGGQTAGAASLPLPITPTSWDASSASSVSPASPISLASPSLISSPSSIASPSSISTALLEEAREAAMKAAAAAFEAVLSKK